MTAKEEKQAVKKVNAAARKLLRAEAALMEVELPEDLITYEGDLLDYTHNLVHRIIRENTPYDHD